MTAFERFKRKKRLDRKGKFPFVTIIKNGFRFSKKAFELYIGSKSHIELFWDEENKRIGFKVLGNPSENSYRVYLSRQKPPIALVYCSDFINEFQLKEFVGHCFVLKKDGETVDFYIELKKREE